MTAGTTKMRTVIEQREEEGEEPWRSPEQIQKAAAIHAGMKQLHDQMRQLLGSRGAD